MLPSLRTILPAILVILLAVSQQGPAHGTGFPVCDGREVARPDVLRAVGLDAIEKFVALFRRAEAPEPDPAVPHFTIRQGFSYLPDCSRDDGIPRLITWMMYPAGLIVRPITEFEAEGARYYLVEAEYGFRFLIRPADLDPMEYGRTYIFPNSIHGYEYCLGPCNMKQLGRLHASDDTYVVIGHYLPTDHNGRFPSCEMYHGTVYQRGQTRPHSIYINPCRGNQLDPRLLKIVTLPDAPRYMKRDFHARFHREGNWFFSNIFPSARNYRDCNVSDLTKTKIANEASIGLSTPPIFVFHLQDKVHIEALMERIRKTGAFSFYATYEYVHHESRQLYTVEVISFCDDHNILPREPYVVSIAYPGNKNLPIMIPQELQPKAVTFKASAYAPTTPAFLQEGQLWVVSSIEEFIGLRDALGRYIGAPGVIDGLLKDRRNQWERQTLVDFLSHLVIGAASRFSELPEADHWPIVAYDDTLAPKGIPVSGTFTVLQ